MLPIVQQELVELVLRDDDAAYAVVEARAATELRKRKWHCAPGWIRALGRIGRHPGRRAVAARCVLDGMAVAITPACDNPIGLAAGAVALGLLGEPTAGEELAALWARAARSASYELNIAAGRLAIAAATMRVPLDRDVLAELYTTPSPETPASAEHASAWWVLGARRDDAADYAATGPSPRGREYASRAVDDLERAGLAPHAHAVWTLGLPCSLDLAHDPEANDDLDEEVDLLTGPTP